MPRITLENWDGVVSLLNSVWPDVVYVTAVARFRQGTTEERQPVIRVGPRDEEPTCPKIRARYRADYQYSDDEDLDQCIAELTDATLQDMTVDILRDEIEAWADGIGQPTKVLVQVYGSKGVSLGSKTMTVRDGSGDGGEDTALERSAGRDSVNALAVLGLPDMSEIDDPLVRQLLMTVIMQRQHNDDIAGAYNTLFAELREAYGHLHAVSTTTMSQIERTSRTRYNHMERVETQRLTQLRETIEERKKAAAALPGEDGTVPRPATIDPSVQKEALSTFGNLGDRLVTALLASKGMDPSLAPLLEVLEDTPKLKDKLPGLAKSLKDPEVREAFIGIVEEVAEMSNQQQEAAQ